MQQRMRKLEILAAAALAAIALSAPAGAAPISAMPDPGAVGSSSESFEFDLSAELGGIVFDGQTIVLDAVFADMKHLEVVASPDANFTQVQVSVGFDAPGYSGPFPAEFPDGELRDENGDPVGFKNSSGKTSQPDRYEASTGFSVDNGLVFHGAGLSIPLPDTGESVSAAQLTFEVLAFSNAGRVDAAFAVGDWSDPIPEPSGALVFALGLLVAGAARRRT